MNKLSVWISALRLRTLPLAAASIIVAAGLAGYAQIFDGLIFGLSLLTALLLQILSNLANDYGDALSGADDHTRVGPARAMQSGLITQAEMKRAILLTIALCLLSGFSLLAVALGDHLYSWLLFLLFGLLSVAAAISYTMGKLSYGYRALGDLSVFIFFGLLGVLGSYYLYNLTLDLSLLLPATSFALLSVAVLNINNMRDFYTDGAAGKTTLVVLMGRKKAFIYHLLLVLTAPVLALCYLLSLDNMPLWLFLVVLIFIPLIKSCLSLYRLIRDDVRGGDLFNEQLKKTAMTTFVFSLLFSILLITAH